MRSYSSREVIRILERHGWILKRVTGSHYIFRHEYLPGTVTVKHPEKDLTRKTLDGIEKQSGIVFR